MSTVLEHFSVAQQQHAKPVRVAIYVRISSDRTGAGLGVARQEEDCRALCERLGWTVARAYVDGPAKLGDHPDPGRRMPRTRQRAAAARSQATMIRTIRL
jgi:hypothetical protein